MTTALTVVVLVCFAYLLLVNLVALVFLVIGAFENAVRKHDADSNDFATLETSRFTIPVSVIVAAYDEEVVIESTVRSLLAFDYPEFEVVVVNDGSSDDDARAPEGAFDLAPYEMFLRRIFTTQPVRGIYRSRDHPNLVVVDKENGGKADSWNAALNLARYRYVCGVDADTVFDPKALLHGDAGRDQRPRADRRRDEPDHDGRATRKRSSRRRWGDGASTAGCSASISTSTSSARSSTIASPGRGSASCSARRAASRSGGGTSSRRSAATRRRSPARTSSSPSASTSAIAVKGATTRSGASPTASA